MSLYNLSQYDGFNKGQLNQFSQKRYADLINDPVRLGARILPDVPVEDWEVEVGKVEFRNVASAIIGPDSLLPRGPLGTQEAKMFSLLKGGMKYVLKETELLKLRQVFQPGAKISPAAILRSRPYQLANSLTLGFLDRVEQMRWEALSTGEYVIPNSGGAKVDWGFPGGNQITLTTTDLWSAPTTATGLADMLAWDAILFDELGVHSAYTVMSTASLNKLLVQNSTKTILANAGYAGIGGTVTSNTNQLGIPFFIDAVNGYLARYGVGPIVLYDRKYAAFDFTGATQPALTRYLGEDHFVMIAPSAMDGGTGPNVGTATGYTAIGPSVQNDFQPGLYVWMTEQDEPYEVSVKSEFWALPTIGDPRTIVSGTLD